MPDRRDPWAHRGNLTWIEAQLRSRGLDPARPTIEDLAIHDQLHSGGLAATRTFIEWIAPPGGARILDLGAGLGGTARVLARDHGCVVTAVEPSRPLHEVGRELTARVGLEDRVSHLRGDANTIGAGSGFDIVLIQHVDMHVEDKAALYRGCAGALTPGGRLVWHDWLGGAGGAPWYPTPWSRGGEGSFLRDEEAHRGALARAGFSSVIVSDRGRETRAWIRGSIAALGRALARPRPDDPALRERRLELERLLVASENVLRNIEERRLVPFFGEAEACAAGTAGP